MARKQSQMKKLMIFVTVAALLCHHLTISTSDDSWTLPENSPFTVALIFSGDTRNNITACPWIFDNNNSEKIIGSNQEFQKNFSQDLSNEISTYPQIVDFSIEYTYTWHYFNELGQYDPDHRWYPMKGKNVSKFDPYYGYLRFEFDSNKTWDSQLAGNIEIMLLNKWYVERVLLIPDARLSSPSLFGMEQLYLIILATLIIGALSRRKSQSS